MEKENIMGPSDKSEEVKTPEEIMSEKEKSMILSMQGLKKSVSSEIYRVLNENKQSFNCVSLKIDKINREKDHKTTLIKNEADSEIRSLILDYFIAEKEKRGNDKSFNEFMKWWESGENEETLQNSNVCFGNLDEQIEKIIIEQNEHGYDFEEDDILLRARTKIKEIREKESEKIEENVHFFAQKIQEVKKQQEEFNTKITHELRSLGLKNFTLSKQPRCGLEQAKEGKNIDYIYTNFFNSFEELKDCIENRITQINKK